MMVLSPAVAGIVAAWAYRGFAWTPWWLLICWLLCYCVQFSAARWFKSHGAHRWMLQPLVYCIVLCAVGLPFVVLHPGILAWAPPFAVLAAMPGVPPFPSAATFVLARFADAAAVFEALKARGILVRNLSAMHPLMAGTLRISVGTGPEMEALLAALREIL